MRGRGEGKGWRNVLGGVMRGSKGSEESEGRGGVRERGVRVRGCEER